MDKEGEAKNKMEASFHSKTAFCVGFLAEASFFFPFFCLFLTAAGRLLQLILQGFQTAKLQEGNHDSEGQ